jgi:uncharacterized DUF497 family protein
MDGLLSGFEWDQGNLAHCRKHGVSRPEIESIFDRRLVILPDEGHSQSEKRFKAIGRTRLGRRTFIVFTIREHGGRRHIRPISARYMHRQEIESYEKENPGL